MTDTVVFIPAWNEEASLPGVLAELSAELGAVDVLVVDDGSTDDTAGVARASGAALISFPENRGLAAAVAAGYTYAAERGYRFCARVDADGQHPAAELRELLARVRSGACDVAVGSRFASGEGHPERRYEPTAPRRLGHFLLRRLVRRRLAGPMLDATSGFYVVNEQALPFLAEPYETGAPEVEGLLRLAEAGLRVDEVPVEMRERTAGGSRLRGKKALLFVVTLTALLLFGERRRRA